MSALRVSAFGFVAPIWFKVPYYDFLVEVLFRG